MADPLLTVLLVVWGLVMVVGGGGAAIAGHRAHDDAGERRGIGGYVLAALMVVLGLIIWAMAVVTL